MLPLLYTFRSDTLQSLPFDLLLLSEVDALSTEPTKQQVLHRQSKRGRDGAYTMNTIVYIIIVRCQMQNTYTIASREAFFDELQSLYIYNYALKDYI